ncbi:FtsK family DNA translocase [Hafnia paralvei ATCC 29927]|uniref:DNA translocase FtsK n=1 Tax=Hafnia paralvei TaxID=546367 RepID=UPI0007E40977|nr:DNA translocase FtsK [Hafnia paralvei]OAT41112.1 FtsK family DNA translocase [Hafnia paralvei ATCC 29927]
MEFISGGNFIEKLFIAFGNEDEGFDPLISATLQFILTKSIHDKTVSISQIQRHFRIGYNRANTIHNVITAFLTSLYCQYSCKMTLVNLNNSSLKSINSLLFYSDELIVIDLNFSNQEQRISFLRGSECWRSVNNQGIIHGDINTGLFIGEILIEEDSYLFKLENLIKLDSDLIKATK